MKFKLLGNNDYLIDPITTILTNRGVNPQTFFNINDSCVNAYTLLNQIDDGVQCLIKHIQELSETTILVDSDFDGYASASMIYKYIQTIAPTMPLQYIVHKGKEHGLDTDTMEILLNNPPKLLIIPDAGSNDLKQHAQLKELGTEIIVLDHHQCAEVSIDAIVINNQISQYPNKNLAGVGIVYKFLQAMDEALQIKQADEYLDLVAIGNIADCMDSRECETRYYMIEGIKSIKNKFMLALIEKQEYSLKSTVNFNGIAFYIVPLVNACVRFGSDEEKDKLFKAFLNANIEYDYKPRGKVTTIKEHITTHMARICSNIKQRQNNAKEKSVELLEERILEKQLHANKILIVNASGLLDPSLSGLVATELANKYKRPVILLKYYKDDVFGGSARGYDKSDLKDFRQFLINSNKFLFCEGHNNAFGIQIRKEDLMGINIFFNEKLKNYTFEDVYDVDFIIPASQLNDSVIRAIDTYKDVWSRYMEEPLVAVTEMNIDTKDIQLLGANKNTIKFMYRGITFLLFNTNEEQLKTFANYSSVQFELVGRCSMNLYDGRESPQVIIKDFNFKPLDTDLFATL